MEELLGVRLENKYQTMQYYDDKLPGESPPKDKSYIEKKKERDQQERKAKLETH